MPHPPNTSGLRQACAPLTSATITNTLGTFTFGYTTTLSRVDSFSRPGSLTTTNTYKPNNAPGHSARALESIAHTGAGGAVIASHTYSYDPAGRITAWQQQGAGITATTQRFAYNLGDELIHADKTQDSDSTVLDQENWALDAAGNWLSRTRENGAVMETRSHNVMNRLTAIGGNGSTVVEGGVNEFAQVTVNGAAAQLSVDPVGGYRYRRSVPVQGGSNTVTVQATDTTGQTTTTQWQFTVPTTGRSFSYDANGNTLNDGQRTFTWDVKNRLRSVTKAGTTWKWDYDHQDRRVREYENNTLTKVFIWSGTKIVQERNANNTITRTHYSGGFSDGGTPASGTKYQTLTDHLGHVREVVGSDGTLATRYDYTSYQGPVKLSGTVEATFQTIGRYYHHAGSGLEMAMYRAYDPELGRWLNEDPIAEQGGLNLYGYVRNEPLLRVDPLGLQEKKKSCVPAVAAQIVRDLVGRKSKATEEKARNAIDPNRDWNVRGATLKEAIPYFESHGLQATFIKRDEMREKLAQGGKVLISVLLEDKKTLHAYEVERCGKNNELSVWDPADRSFKDVTPIINMNPGSQPLWVHK